jgi:tetratricopeptide (TPR) repeat protein
MSDSLRNGDSRTIDGASDAERDAKIERLLIAGLDHYFAARYEQAINVWTRALFFDRGHPRARAYIDRARSALAERQRESEELLQRGLAAFRDGDRDEAKRLLQAAIDSGAPADEALPLLDRLHRDGEAGLSVSGGPQRAMSIASTPFSSRSRVASVVRSEPSPSKSGALIAGSLLLTILVGLSLYALRETISLQRSANAPDAPVGAALAPASRDVALPLPRRSEMALDRARALVADGHLHEALTALDVIRSTDPQKPEADRVRSDIQHQLLRRATNAQPASDAPDK